MFEKYPRCQGNDIELLKLGRHFWQNKVKIIVGRNEEENKKIRKSANKGDVLVEMENYSGPLTLVRSYSGKKIDSKILEKARFLTKYYSTKSRQKKDVKFKILSG